MKKKTIAFLAIAMSFVFFSCKKEIQYQNRISSKVPVFNFQDTIEPAILKLMHADLIKDGYNKKAEELSEEYNFTTGIRIDATTNLVFPTTSVSGVGTVISGVTFTESFGPSTSYRSGGASNTISFNAMNSGAALHALVNSTPPSGTFLACSGALVGVKFPVIKMFATDALSDVYSTPFVPIFYEATDFGGTNFAPTYGNLAGTTSGCGSSNCWLQQLKINFASYPTYNAYLYDNAGNLTTTQVTIKLYFRTSSRSFGLGSSTWSNWVSAGTFSSTSSPNSLSEIQVRVYLIKL